MNIRLMILLSVVVVLLAACSSAQVPEVTYDPASLRFDGQRAYEIEDEFVTSFKNRVSGSEQTRLATEWLEKRFASYGLSCQSDDWTVINYSRPTPLRNVVCWLPGTSPQEIVLVAHHDIASTTIEGADNDGSGIAILLQLAEVFAAEEQLPYTLVFVASDGEEYGMLGTGRFIETHPDPKNIIAAFILDNLGKYYYDAMNMEMIGQYRRFTPLWLALLTRESAQGGGGLWQVNLPSLIDQITGQAVPVSFMDQGPLIAAGVPALGFAAHKPVEKIEEHYAGWHTTEDNMERQSPVALSQSGLVAEAVVRQLLSMQAFPQESGPYLYFAKSQQVLRGLPLWLIFISITALFFLGSFLIARAPLAEKLKSWRAVLPHFLSFWLPLIAFVLMLYLFVETGLLLKFYRYPATTKDPYLIQPNWSVFALALVGLAVLLFIGHWIAQRYAASSQPPHFGVIKSFALFVIGLGAVYILVLNPFSLLFIIPLLFWFLIAGRKGWGRILDIIFFVLGGLMLYALIYMFGFLTLRYDFAFLWMLMNMIADRMVSFPTMVIVAAFFAAGLSMVVPPPEKTVEKVRDAVTPAAA